MYNTYYLFCEDFETNAYGKYAKLDTRGEECNNMKKEKVVYGMKKLVCLFMVLFVILLPTLSFASSDFDLGEATAAFLAAIDRSMYDGDPDAFHWENFDRASPTPLGTTIWWKSSSSSQAQAYVEMRVVDVIRGEKANELAIEKNRFNKDDITDEKEFIYVRLSLKMLSDDMNRKYSVSGFDFDFVSQAGLVYKHDFASGFDDSLKMYAGAQGEIEFCHVISKDDNPLLTYDDDIWLSLTAE